MPRYVIDPEVALTLAERRAILPPGVQLLAPTLLRSQVLAQLYAQVQRGALARAEAGQRLDDLRRLPLRLLGDRVLQRQAWEVAHQLGWADTFMAEYIALAQLQADALVTGNAMLAPAAARFVVVEPPGRLLG